MDDENAARRSRLYRNAMLTEALKARAGGGLAEDLKVWLQGAAHRTEGDLEAHLGELQAALAAYATAMHHIQQELPLYVDVWDVLEGLRPAARRRLRDDWADLHEHHLESVFPDTGEVSILTTAGTIRAIARLLGLDTEGVKPVRSGQEATPWQSPQRRSPSRPSTTPRSPISTEPASS